MYVHTVPGVTLFSLSETPSEGVGAGMGRNWLVSNLPHRGYHERGRNGPRHFLQPLCADMPGMAANC